MISIIKKYLSLILMLVVIVMCFLYLKSCNQHSRDLKKIAELKEYKHIVKKYKSKNGTTVNYNNTIEVTAEVTNAISPTRVTDTDGSGNATSTNYWTNCVTYLKGGWDIKQLVFTV